MADIKRILDEQKLKSTLHLGSAFSQASCSGSSPIRIEQSDLGKCEDEGGLSEIREQVTEEMKTQSQNNLEAMRSTQQSVAQKQMFTQSGRIPTTFPGQTSATFMSPTSSRKSQLGQLRHIQNSADQYSHLKINIHTSLNSSLRKFSPQPPTIVAKDCLMSDQSCTVLNDISNTEWQAEKSYSTFGKLSGSKVGVSRPVSRYIQPPNGRSTMVEFVTMSDKKHRPHKSAGENQ